MGQQTLKFLNIKLLFGSSLVIVINAFVATLCFADIYSWEDEKGATHYTNSISTIPRDYRDKATLIRKTKQTEKLFENEIKTQPERKKNNAAKDINNQRTVVPLRQSRNALIVSAILNGSNKALFVVDTGATITTISKEMAEKLRIKITPNMPVLSLRTANGIVDTPLIKLKSIKVGDQEQKDVMTVIHDAVPGFTGLLGLTFLNEFNYSINPVDQELILDSLEKPGNDKLYSGHGQKWWKRKFRILRGFARNEKEGLEKLRGMKNKVTDKRGLASLERHIRKKQNNLKYFEKELRSLGDKATLAMVPIQWQQ